MENKVKAINRNITNNLFNGVSTSCINNFDELNEIKFNAYSYFPSFPILMQQYGPIVEIALFYTRHKETLWTKYSKGFNPCNLFINSITLFKTVQLYFRAL